MKEVAAAEEFQAWTGDAGGQALQSLGSRASGTGCSLPRGSCWAWLSNTETRARGLDEERCPTGEMGVTREDRKSVV